MSINASDGWQALVETALDARILCEQHIQTLWSGYGRLLRLHLSGGSHQTVVMKHILVNEQVSRNIEHPRGWQSDFAHQRKLQSYSVEASWYRDYAASVHCQSRVPVPLFVHETAESTLLVMEDLDTRFPHRLELLTPQECKLCLSWLAAFHAQFMSSGGKGLWPCGSYWQLKTRPDEYQAMPEGALKIAAHALDSALNTLDYSTLIHGDAKAANFCLSADRQSVSAVDFQYVGRGCGMRDVVYLLGSFFDTDGLEAHADVLLDGYLDTLCGHLEEVLNSSERQALIAEWRSLYGIAWADFQRFLVGWSPNHPKINPYVERQTSQALQKLSI
ncbi:MAG: phosphotransferase [Granulosicoccus sp.]